MPHVSRCARRDVGPPGPRRNERALAFALFGILLPSLTFADSPTIAAPPGSELRDKPAAEDASADPAKVGGEAPYGSFKWDYSPLGVYGPTFTSPDRQNQLTLGLFVWYDNSFVLDDKELASALDRDEIDGDSRIATARLEINGRYTQDYWYYLRIDFQDNGSGSGDSAVEWAALGLSNLPVVQNLIVGLQMPTYSLDIWGNYVRTRPFLEPSLVNAFFHGPLLGVTAYDVNPEGRYSWALGIARDTTEETAAGSQAVDRGEDDFIVHGRFSFMPRYRDLGRHMIHFGISGALIKPEDETLVWGVWPEVYTDDVELYPLVIIDNAKKAILGIFEFRSVEGPFWMQSDYFYNKTKRDTADDLAFSSFYVEAGYFLTGHQTVFSPLTINGQVMPIPETNRTQRRWGAWEVLARYSQLDLQSKEFQGGTPTIGDGAKVTNYTVGLNWYLNQHIRIGVNYVHSVREDLDDAAFDVILTRVAWTL